MSADVRKTMRDSLIERIYHRMRTDEDIFFLSADMGAPILDHVRADFADRFINVGIAEQNMVNVATGLALEGFKVFAYAIAPFFLRAFEQIRIDLALMAQHHPLNVNLIGVGGGVSYDVSGPTHHCLEDLTTFRALPNVHLFSPCDWYGAADFLDYALEVPKPKYIRLDGKAFPAIYSAERPLPAKEGFCTLRPGQQVMLVATGHMTRIALEVAARFAPGQVGVIDLFLLKPVAEEKLVQALAGCHHIITMEEGFTDKGGLDALLRSVHHRHGLSQKMLSFGFQDEYMSKFGNREYLYQLNGCDAQVIAENVGRCLQQ
ncbi:MAG: transketolase [Magnetococcales bacterium]|nr:transketolase [Magnetococcales bacterium]MBF0321410.1 transketolase [Magnetococcales bacterium]